MATLERDSLPLLPPPKPQRRRCLRTKAQRAEDEVDQDEEDWTEEEELSSTAPSLPSLLELHNLNQLHPHTTSPSPVTPAAAVSSVPHIAIDGLDVEINDAHLSPLPIPAVSGILDSTRSTPPLDEANGAGNSKSAAQHMQEYQNRLFLQQQQRMQLQQIQQAQVQAQAQKTQPQQQKQQKDSQKLFRTTPFSAPANQTVIPQQPSAQPPAPQPIQQPSAHKLRSTSSDNDINGSTSRSPQKQFKARETTAPVAAVPPPPQPPSLPPKPTLPHAPAGWRTSRRIHSMTATDSETDDDGLHIPALILAPTVADRFASATYIPSQRPKKNSRAKSPPPPQAPLPGRVRGHQQQYHHTRQGTTLIPRLAGLNFLPARRRTRRPDATPGAFIETLSDLEDTSAMPVLKRVSAYCIAQAFEWTSIVGDLARMRATHTHLSDDVVRVQIPGWPVDGDAFLFGTYGVIIFWSMEEHHEDKFLTAVRGWLDDDNLLGQDEEKDCFTWFHDPSASSSGFSIWNNCFVLPNASNPEDDALNRLAVAYSIATSVKLDTFEVAIEKTITATQGLPLELANEGRMTLSKREVSKYIGELYIQKSSVNLVHDILDTPTFPDYPQDLERTYLKCRKFLNIDTRCEVLNKRLDVLAELLEILRSEKAEQHSTRLEWIVIFLIVVEVVLGLLGVVNKF